MFEKEAEEYVPNINWHAYNSKEIREEMMLCYRKGAEFGYKKGQSDQLVHKQYQLNQLRKANEWHYVNWRYFADKAYPESETAMYLVQLRNKDLRICEWEVEEGFGCFWDITLESIDNDDVYAWKEIVLPKEIKEND